MEQRSVKYSFDIKKEDVPELLEAIARGDLSEHGVNSGNVVELRSEPKPRLPGTKNNLTIILEEERIDLFEFCETTDIYTTDLAMAIRSATPPYELGSSVLKGLEQMTGKRYEITEVFPHGYDLRIPL